MRNRGSRERPHQQVCSEDHDEPDCQVTEANLVFPADQPGGRRAGSRWSGATMLPVAAPKSCAPNATTGVIPPSAFVRAVSLEAAVIVPQGWSGRAGNAGSRARDRRPGCHPHQQRGALLPGVLLVRATRSSCTNGAQADDVLAAATRCEPPASLLRMPGTAGHQAETGRRPAVAAAGSSSTMPVLRSSAFESLRSSIEASLIAVCAGLANMAA